MQKLGISPELIPSGTCHREGPCEIETSVQNSVAHFSIGKNEETASVTFATGQVTNVSSVHDEDPLLKKRQKVGRLEERSFVSPKATENSIVDWLKNYDAGVSWMDDPNHCCSLYKPFLCCLFFCVFISRDSNTC